MNTDFIKDNFQFVEYILVNETAENQIYIDKELTEPISSVKDYNNKLVKVVSHFEDEGIKRILIEYKEVLVGWIEINTSIPLFNKKEEKIEVDYETFYSPEINMLINKKGDYNLYFQRYQVYSRFFAFYNGELLEAIFRKNTFVAFAPSSVIDRMIYIGERVELEKGEIELYATSKMDDKIELNQLNVDEPVDVISFFPKLKRARVRQGGVAGWISSDHLIGLNAVEYIQPVGNEAEIISFHKEMIYLNEQATVKNILTKLLNENITLEKKLLKQKALTKRVMIRYANLRNSKLGKIQLLFWNKRAKRGKK